MFRGMYIPPPSCSWCNVMTQVFRFGVPPSRALSPPHLFLSPQSHLEEKLDVTDKILLI